MRTLKIMNSLTCKEGPSVCGYHPSCLAPPYTFSGGPLSCGRAAPSLSLMCEPGDGERDVDVWGWQTRVCLRVCTKMMCDERGRADERTCTRLFVQHTSGRVRNWWGWGILYAERLSGFPGPGWRVRGSLPADLRAAWGGGGLCRMK